MFQAKGPATVDAVFESQSKSQRQRERQRPQAVRRSRVRQSVKQDLIPWSGKTCTTAQP